MSIDFERARKLVADVQIAHRLVVAFYQRLLPSLDDIARQLEFDFWYWEPLHTSRPCTSGRQPTKSWLWDMLPLYASTYVYRKVAGGNLQATDKAIQFLLHVDEGFMPETRKAAKIRGEPDPLTLPAGRATLRIDLFKGSVGECNESFDAVWEDTDQPDLVSGSWQAVHACLEGRSIVVDLSEFMSNPEPTISSLREFSSS